MSNLKFEKPLPKGYRSVRRFRIDDWIASHTVDIEARNFLSQIPTVVFFNIPLVKDREGLELILSRKDPFGRIDFESKLERLNIYYVGIFNTKQDIFTQGQSLVFSEDDTVEWMQSTFRILELIKKKDEINTSETILPFSITYGWKRLKSEYFEEFVSRTTSALGLKQDEKEIVY